MVALPLESAIRPVVNDYFRGRDAFDTVKAVALGVLLLRLLRKLRRIATREGLRSYFLGIVLPYVKMLPPVKKELEKEAQKVRDSLRPTMCKDLTQPRDTLPEKGLAKQDLCKLMEERHELDTKYWKDGKVTGSIYSGEQEHMEFIGEVYKKWAYTNPLHPGIHPSVRQMDAEVVQMVVNMYNGGPDACGSFTTGGTESILMSMKAYRDWGKAEKGITDPNIVICDTAHAAFDKGGQYFGIFVKHCRAVPGSQEIDIRHLKSLIDSNTVAIVGSACQYASGCIDPIEEMAQIALKNKIGLHVDCCLGGFLVPFMDKAGFPLKPFDFRVKGVTTISCDPHKYGFAPKGCSVVMFSEKRLRHYMYSFITDWTGGIYATMGILGSRPGGPVAATWASMMKHGEEGYVATTKLIVGATKRAGDAVKAIPELQLLGRTDVCVVAFTTTPASGLNIYSLGDCMKARTGWDMATLQNPPGIHMAFTMPTAKNIDTFIADLRSSVKALKEDVKGEFAGGNAGIYGTVASIPPALVQESVKVYLDTVMEATAL